MWLQDRLVDEGYNPSYGARPLRRAITRLLEDSMAEQMLRGDIKVWPSPWPCFRCCWPCCQLFQSLSAAGSAHTLKSPSPAQTFP